MKHIFINQWSLKLFIITAILPCFALVYKKFDLIDIIYNGEGTWPWFCIMFGGCATIAYLTFGIVLGIRELLYQARVATHKEESALDFENFYHAYKTINEQIKWEERNQTRNQPSKIITLRRIEEIDPPPLPTSGPYPELDDEQKKMGVALHYCSIKQKEMGRELTEEEARVIYRDVYAELSAQPKYYLPNFMYSWLTRVIIGFIVSWVIILLFAYLWTNVFHMEGR
jgi:hypothetical protein